MVSSHDKGIGNFNEQFHDEQRRATAFKQKCQLETADPSRNYARVPGYKKKGQEKDKKKRKINGVEIHTHAYVATRLLPR